MTGLEKWVTAKAIALLVGAWRAADGWLGSRRARGGRSCGIQ